MTEYLHKVQYYETDKMGMTHHSNYLRFMEEARTDFLEKIGYSYKRMEDEGLISPVVSANLNYKKSTTYADEILVQVKLKSISAAKTEFEYVMRVGGEVVCLAESTHCFLNQDGRPVAIKRLNPKLFELLSSLVEE